MNKIPSAAPPTSSPRPEFKNEGKLVPKTKAPRDVRLDAYTGQLAESIRLQKPSPRR